jgi:hypothetical protein
MRNMDMGRMMDHFHKFARRIRLGYISIDPEADPEISCLTRRLKCDPELVIKNKRVVERRSDET